MLTVILDLDLFFHLLVERVTKYIHKWDHFSNSDSKNDTLPFKKSYNGENQERAPFCIHATVSFDHQSWQIADLSQRFEKVARGRFSTLAHQKECTIQQQKYVLLRGRESHQIQRER